MIELRVRRSRHGPGVRRETSGPQASSARSQDARDESAGAQDGSDAVPT